MLRHKWLLIDVKVVVDFLGLVLPSLRGFLRILPFSFLLMLSLHEHRYLRLRSMRLQDPAQNVFTLACKGLLKDVSDHFAIEVVGVVARSFTLRVAFS